MSQWQRVTACQIAINQAAGICQRLGDNRLIQLGITPMFCRFDWRVGFLMTLQKRDLI